MIVGILLVVLLLVTLLAGVPIGVSIGVTSVAWLADTGLDIYLYWHPACRAVSIALR